MRRPLLLLLSLVLGTAAASAPACTTPTRIVDASPGTDAPAPRIDAPAPVDAPMGCAAGTIDLDDDPTNGCEYGCTRASDADEPDSSFVDANCDGIDGTVTAAIFVSEAGDDANDGTMAAPVRTIARALMLAAGGGLDVYLDRGTYAETVTLVDGVNLHGGFDRTVSRPGSITGYWDRRADAVTTIEGGPIAIEGQSLTTGIVLDRLTIHSADATAAGQPSIGVWIRSSTGAVRVSACTIVAGDGAAGTDGGTGVPGDPGAPAAGLVGGTSSCGASGGNGGTGGLAGAAGMAGANAPLGGGAGGAGGAAVACPASTGTAVGRPGVAGGAGTSGAIGTDGLAGDGLGSLRATGAWRSSDGVDGMDGIDGGGGGGGDAAHHVRRMPPVRHGRGGRRRRERRLRRDGRRRRDRRRGLDRHPGGRCHRRCVGQRHHGGRGRSRRRRRARRARRRCWCAGHGWGRRPRRPRRRGWRSRGRR